jgi:hypothetical protein
MCIRDRGIAAGVALILKFQKAIAGWAKESGKVDNATLAVMRYGDTLTAVGKGAIDAGKAISVNLLGSLNLLGEWIGSGFDMGSVNADNASERGAIQQEQALAKLRAENDPAKLAATRASISQFQRDQRFAGASPKEQQRILADEVMSLKIQEDKARAAKQILVAENLRLDRLKKEAELQKLITEQTKEREEREAAIIAMRPESTPSDPTDALNARLDEAMKEIEGEQLSARPSRVQSRAGSLRNPFEGAGVSGFGSASNGSLVAVQEGNRLLTEQLRILKTIEENTEDAISQRN